MSTDETKTISERLTLELKWLALNFEAIADGDTGDYNTNAGRANILETIGLVTEVEDLESHIAAMHEKIAELEAVVKWHKKEEKLAAGVFERFSAHCLKAVEKAEALRKDPRPDCEVIDLFEALKKSLAEPPIAEDAE